MATKTGVITPKNKEVAQTAVNTYAETANKNRVKYSRAAIGMAQKRTNVVKALQDSGFEQREQLFAERKRILEQSQAMHDEYYAKFGDVLNEQALEFLMEHSMINAPTLTSIMTGYEMAKKSAADNARAMMQDRVKLLQEQQQLDTMALQNAQTRAKNTYDAKMTELDAEQRALEAQQAVDADIAERQYKVSSAPVENNLKHGAISGDKYFKEGGDTTATGATGRAEGFDDLSTSIIEKYATEYGVDPQIAKQSVSTLENTIFNAESNAGKALIGDELPDGGKALGNYHITPDTLPTTLNHLGRHTGGDLPWMAAVRESGDILSLTRDQQRQLLTAHVLEGAKANETVPELLSGDPGALEQGYYKLWYKGTITPDITNNFNRSYKIATAPVTAPVTAPDVTATTAPATTAPVAATPAAATPAAATPAAAANEEESILGKLSASATKLLGGFPSEEVMAKTPKYGNLGGEVQEGAQEDAVAALETTELLPVEPEIEPEAKDIETKTVPDTLLSKDDQAIRNVDPELQDTIITPVPDTVDTGENSVGMAPGFKNVIDTLYSRGNDPDVVDYTPEEAANEASLYTDISTQLATAGIDNASTSTDLTTITAVLKQKGTSLEEMATGLDITLPELMDKIKLLYPMDEEQEQ